MRENATEPEEQNRTCNLVVISFGLITVFLLLYISSLSKSSRYSEVSSIPEKNRSSSNLAYLLQCPELNTERMILVGAMGGSGTRGLQELLNKLFWFGGAEVNKAGDNMSCFSFLHTRAFLRSMHRANWTWDELVDSRSLLPRRRGNLLYATRRKLNGVDCMKAAERSPGSCLWGFKHPRSMFLWPVYNHLFPKSKFVHLVRDGRDIAFSMNWRQVKAIGRFYFPPELTENIKDLFQDRIWTPEMGKYQIMYWNQVNREVHQLGKRLGETNYKLVRIEDFVTPDLVKRKEAVVDLLVFVCDGLGLSRDTLESISSELLSVFDIPIFSKHGMSYGKWKLKPLEQIQAFEEIGRESLELFGYLEKPHTTTQQ